MANRKPFHVFRSEHPSCIYGAGVCPTEERDHVPSRQLFNLRSALEEYEFPSCAACNRVTKDAEQVIAFLARLYPDGQDGQEKSEFVGIMGALRNNYPAVLGALQPTARQVRDHLKSLEGAKDPNVGTWEYNLLSVRSPLIEQCMMIFTRKLISALHYKETRQIIPMSGGIAWNWYSNVQVQQGKVPEEVLRTLTSRPIVQRSRQDLSGQFDYGHTSIEERQIAVYFVTFRLSFAIMGIVAMDASKLPEPPPGARRGLLRPLSPQERERVSNFSTNVLKAPLRQRSTGD